MGFNVIVADVEKYKDAILNLWKDNIPEADFNERYDWLYKNNPSGLSQTVIAINEKTGEVVGAGSIYPQKVLMFGKKATIGIAADFMVDKRFRVFGPAIRIQRKLTEFLNNSVYDFLFVYPNKAAMGVFKHIGYKNIGFPNRFVKILKTREKITLKIKSNFLSQVIASFLDILIIIDDIFKAIPSIFKYSIKVHNDFKNFLPNYNESNYFNNFIVSDKTIKSLKWKHHNCIKKSSVFLLKSKIKEDFSFIVYNINNGIVSIDDIYFSTESLFRPLLSLFILQMHKLKCKQISIQLLGNTYIIKALMKFRFIVRENDRGCFALFKNDTKRAFYEKLLSQNSWLFLEPDMDL